VAAAAQALDLDFIPLFDEEYDLVIPRAFEHTPLLAPLFEVGRSEAFRQAVAALRGYDVSRMAEKLAEVG
jgi:putative molybdopterin biosynthesis protein